VLLPETQVELSKRLTFKIVKVGEKTEVQVVNRSDVPDYWGFIVTVENRSIKRIIEDRRFELIIGTSRFATSVQEAAKSLSEKWARANTILLLFGAPTRGLFEIAKDEHINLHKVVDFVLNTLPNQGTETVRTEEAFLATLAIFNVQFGI
jgi:predicted SPOUT superfamily RNA methylase MTH1